MMMMMMMTSSSSHRNLLIATHIGKPLSRRGCEYICNCERYDLVKLESFLLVILVFEFNVTYYNCYIEILYYLNNQYALFDNAINNGNIN